MAMRCEHTRARHHLTAGDVEFLLSALADTPKSREALTRLIVDPEALDLILESKRLFEALKDNTLWAQVSSRFFFYVCIRREFCSHGLEDRELADYVSGILAEFSRRENLFFPFKDEGAPMLMSMDYYREVGNASQGQRFHLHASAGNHYLFMTSFFANFIEERARRKGAPGVGYYENVGRLSYAAARDHRLAREYALEEVFDQLAVAFPEARAGLSDVAAGFQRNAA